MSRDEVMTIEDVTPTAVVLPPPVMLYRLQFSDGEPNSEWHDTGNPLGSLEWALAVLRHLSRDALFAWRVCDSAERTLVMVVPGTKGDS